MSSTGQAHHRASLVRNDEKSVNMIVSVILAHPDPASFNHAIAHITVEALKANGHIVFFHDLVVVYDKDKGKRKRRLLEQDCYRK